jgi:hypothetical protein
MVTASDLLEERFTMMVAASSGISLFERNGVLFTRFYSAAASKVMVLRNPDVFHAP